MHLPENLLLFVYGTLRPDFNQTEGVFDSQFYHSDYRQMGRVKAPGRLYDLGEFPAMKPAEQPGDWVHGDLLMVTSAKVFIKLDRYEEATPRNGRPPLFERRLSTVVWGEAAHPAWMYFYLLQVSEDQRLADGIWAGKR